jgi:hypothetical protein
MRETSHAARMNARKISKEFSCQRRNFQHLAREFIFMGRANFVA